MQRYCYLMFIEYISSISIIQFFQSIVDYTNQIRLARVIFWPKRRNATQCNGAAVCAVQYLHRRDGYITGLDDPCGFLIIQASVRQDICPIETARSPGILDPWGPARNPSPCYRVSITLLLLE